MLRNVSNQVAKGAFPRAPQSAAPANCALWDLLRYFAFSPGSKMSVLDVSLSLYGLYKSLRCPPGCLTFAV